MLFRDNNLFLAFCYCLQEREWTSPIAIAIPWRAITIKRAISKRSYETILKTEKKWNKEIKSDKLIGNNTEKSTISVAKIVSYTKNYFGFGRTNVICAVYRITL